MRWTALLMTIVLATPGCTVVGVGTAAGVTGLHNAAVEEPDDWDYTTPMIVGAALGLVADIVLFTILKRQWSKPMT